MDQNKGVTRLHFEEGSRVYRWIRGVIELGFVAVAAAAGVFLALREQGWLPRPGPVLALTMLFWCPLFWGQYWIAQRQSGRAKWVYFAAASGVTAAALLLIAKILWQLIR